MFPYCVYSRYENLDYWVIDTFIEYQKLHFSFMSNLLLLLRYVKRLEIA